MADWMRGDVMIAMKDQPGMFRKESALICGPWVVSQTLNVLAPFKLTHIPTGARAAFCMTEDAGRAFAQACNMVADWSTVRTLSEVAAIPNVRDLCEHWARAYGLRDDIIGNADDFVRIWSIERSKAAEEASHV